MSIINRQSKMKIYERKLFKEAKKWIDKKAIVVITGMRRVGKTTLLKVVFNEINSRNKVFLDIENPIVQKTFQEENYDNIFLNLKQYGITKDEKAYIFLDEIQAMPGIVKTIKYLFDNYNVQFFLTGSSSFYIKNIFSESLAGRKVIFELYPLDFDEFLLFNEINKENQKNFKEKNAKKNEILHQKLIKYYEEYALFGGFPQVVLAKTIDEKKAFIEDIFKSYFEKDVKSLGDFKDLNALRDLILLLMQRTGTKLNLSKVSSEIGITRQTLYSYLSFLEATYFITLVSPFSRSIDREVAGAKKVYLCDTGMLTHFSRASQGAILENSVFNLIKLVDKLNYYQRRTGAEIDFILKNRKIAIEIKETGTPQDLKKLQGLSKDLKLRESYVVCKNFVKRTGFIPVTSL